MTKYKLVNKIEKKGFPTSSKYYKTAHEEADKVEKKKNPKEYNAMKKVDNKLPRRELSGKNLKSGEILISKKVPPKYRESVAKNHEKVENKEIKKLERKHIRK